MSVPETYRLRSNVKDLIQTRQALEQVDRYIGRLHARLAIVEQGRALPGTDGLDDHEDVTLTAPLATGELVAYNLDKSQWINRTLSEAGIAANDHTHPHTHPPNEQHISLIATGIPITVRASGIYPSKIGPVTSVTTTYTILTSDETILANTSGGAFTITLPTAVGIAGKEYTIKNIGSPVNAVTVDGDGAETIDGTATRIITSQNDSITVRSDGTEYWIH